MTEDYSHCPCQNTGPVDYESLTPEFEKIREQCPALNKVLVPDKIWDEFKEIGKTNLKAEHKSILLLAIERGYINKITSPIHRFLIKKGKISPRVKKQYTKDLNEKWFIKSDFVDRHEKFRIYMGKLVELIFAEWLEKNGFEVINLAAWDDTSTDVIASMHGQEYLYEIKFIGQQNQDFQQVVKSLEGKPGFQRLSVYVPANFLLSKVYEAANQLKNVYQGKRVVVIIIDGFTFYRFKIPLKNSYIDWWNKPTFLEEAKNDPEWKDFLNDKLKKKYPNIEGELPDLIKPLHSIQILQLNPEAFELEKADEYLNPA